MAGKIFGRLTVISFNGKTKRGEILWNCRCDCGTEVVVYGKHLRYGSTKSCGCLCRELTSERHSLDCGEAAFNRLYSVYVRSAKRRKIIWKLTKEEFSKFTKCNCFYCGEPPKKEIDIPGLNGKYIYNGIDRKDSSSDYTIDNCVTCCYKCNIGKGTMTFAEFQEWIITVYKHFCKEEVTL